MAEAACMDVPSGKLSSESTNGTHPKQSTLGQGHEAEPSEQIQHIESGNLCSEPSQQKHNVDSNLSPLSISIVTERSEPVVENKTGENLVMHSLDVIRSCQTGKGSNKDFGCGCLLGSTLKKEDHLCLKQEDHRYPGLAQTVPVETSTAASDCVATENLEPPLEDVSKIQSCVQLESEDVAKSSNIDQFETPSQSFVMKSSQIGCRDKRASKPRKTKYMLRSLVGSDRVLRSRVQEKPKPLESSNSLGTVGNGVEKKRRGRKKGGKKRVIADEFSRTRKRLRYFLNRIRYEQNLIDAYSSEGWKGNSLEKLKPEKELQRATSEILRRKLKIRDLFQQLDSLCAEGRFPKSLFDSEGQIDSEDIFCAKCGSKDLSAGNDIILCDGACDRGFHQFCLEPPLLSEDIPPDDDGWLCPGCDCKVDCIDLLNDSQGTNLSVTDSWEKVFPEAAAAAREGKDQDHNLQLLSDDSDDDDYDPDHPGTVDRNESSSDDSEYTSGSDELEASEKDRQNLGLSSDDSEDDDYDPNAPDVDQSGSPEVRFHSHQQNLGFSSDDSEDNDYDPDAPDVDESAEQESSSSDFTSDSEDLTGALDNEFSGNREVNMSSLSTKQNFKRQGNKSILKDEHLGILDLGPGQDGSPPISGKRKVERLDYKRLHDETYGNVPSDSSDDEDWNGSTRARKRSKTTEQFSSVSPNGNAEAVNYDDEDNEHTPRATCQKSVAKDTNNSPGKLLEGSPKSASTSGRAKSSSYRRLGEAVTQRLYKSFKENQYPDRATKESLAQELGLWPQQVSKWFENMRWSWRHSSGNEAGVSRSAPKDSSISPQANKNPVEIQHTHIGNSTCNGTQNTELPSTSVAMPERHSADVGDAKAKMVAEESSSQKSTIPTPRKRRGRPRIERPETPAVVDTPQTTASRKRGRRRKSAS